MKFNFFLMVFFFAALTAACSTQTVVKSSDAEIIYLKINTKVIDVFNFEKMWGSSEDIDYLERRDFEYGEFGGSIALCSTENFYCLKGGLNVVVPKGNFEQSEWRIGDIKCQFESPFLSELNKTITCERLNHSVTFVYSLEHGITSYTRSSQPERKYELIGSKGLFAQ